MNSKRSFGNNSQTIWININMLPLGNYIFLIGKLTIRYSWNKTKCAFKEFWMIFDKSVKTLNVRLLASLLIKPSKNPRLWRPDEHLCLIAPLICAPLSFANSWLRKTLSWISNCVLRCRDIMNLENKKKRA